LKEKKKDKTPFLTEEEENELKKNRQQPESKSTANIPSKLTCPFVEHGVHIIKDAVLIPCCGHFICCDECIREKISMEELVDCPMKDCRHEIDSLESITSHHQMRNMVNEYLNDVKLNKFTNNKKSSKTDDVFIDLYLNDDFDTINPNPLTNENPVNDTIKKEIFEIETINKIENLNNNEKVKVHGESKLDSSVNYGENQLGFDTSKSSNFYSSNYYQYKANHYLPNPSMFHQQHNIHGFNGGMPPNNYGQPFIPHNNILSGGMQPKQLSEKEFYELKERALKRE